MVQYFKLRESAATAGVTMALLALLGGVAERSRAASPPTASQASLGFLNLKGISSAISSNLLKLENKLVKVDTSLVKLQRSLPKSYLKITTANNTFLKTSSANNTFLKTTDANAQYLKITDADLKYMPASAASSFIQGSGNVLSGAVSTLTTSPQQLLAPPGGIILVEIAAVPAAATVITIHNGTSNTLAGAVDMGDGSGSLARTLTPNADTQLPAVQTNATAEIRLQIFPGGTFTDVVSVLIGLTPNPSTNQVEAVAQAFTGGV